MTIDWTKPLELLDGTPVVLENPDTSDYLDSNPDEFGCYWIHHEDGQSYLTIDGGISRFSCLPYDTNQIRNRKES